ncbi:MAG: SDR family oxidoreductase [Capsulimonadales bacterium]|nr:SDR family oxidoreductase [Capsulimonadales bacterium]
MPSLLNGMRALVTGAGRGVGPVIALRLAEEGAAVALAYRSSRDGADATARRIAEFGGKAVVLSADLRDRAQSDALVASTVAELGGLEIVVNNAAGFGPAKRLEDSDWSDLDEEWQAVVKPVFTVTRAALPILTAQGHGKIVNLSATLLQRPAPTYGAHAMAKAAVLAFTRTLAREVGPRGVTVNAVSPGMTLTEYSQSLPEEERAAVRDRTPLRRLAEPEDVANAVLYFCSPLADFVTGANLAPDGGLAIL